MSIQTDKSLVVVIGDGVNTTFDFDFKIWSKDDISLLYSNKEGDVTDRPIPDNEWSVIITDPQSGVGGRVTYPLSGAPLRDGDKLSIIRDMTFLQPNDYQRGQGYDPDAVENMGDRNTAYCQQLKERLRRAVLAPTGSPTSAEDMLRQLEDLVSQARQYADTIDQALSNLFRQKQIFTTVAGQVAYPLTISGISPTLDNLEVFLGPNFQVPDGNAYVVSPDGKTITFAGDPGVVQCTITTSLSLSNPDLNVFADTANALVKAEADVQVAQVADEGSKQVQLLEDMGVATLAPKNNPAFTGSVMLPSTTYVAPSDANYGGGINFNRGTAQTDITGGAALGTAFQNLFRVIERGGLYRGAVLPVSECAPSGGSKFALLDTAGEPSNFSPKKMLRHSSKNSTGTWTIPNLIPYAPVVISLEGLATPYASYQVVSGGEGGGAQSNVFFFIGATSTTSSANGTHSMCVIPVAETLVLTISELQGTLHSRQ